MGSALDADPTNPWRQKLMPAFFRGALFHVEAGSKESGRRIVVHEFPKKDQPYAEDMGRRAVEFTVRGYCIAYPMDTPVELYRRDYTVARDRLIAELERTDFRGGPLQLPMLPPMVVMPIRYRLTEEERFGGYCTFDMTFVERGASPLAPPVNTQAQLQAASEAMKEQVIRTLSPILADALDAAHIGLIPPYPLPDDVIQALAQSRKNVSAV
jgi:prophage DNA circulation protein